MTSEHPFPPVPAAPPEPPPQPSRRAWRWGAVLAVLLVAGALAVLAASTIEVSYYAVGPGPVEEVDRLVSVEGNTPTYKSEGDFFFLTVILDEVTVLEYLDAALDSRVDLQPREAIRPAGISQEELRRSNLRSMEESKDWAVYVALTRLGYEATLTGDGAVVLGLVEESPAAGKLQAEDIIVALDGEPVQMAGDAVVAVANYRPGQTIVVRVRRPGADGEDPQEFDTQITLGEHPDDDARGFIGVYLDTLNGNAEFPVDVAIDSRNIGGPSAGLMYALSVMDLLTPDDLTKGHRIAGTGTIDDEGSVGAIGGIRQKVFAARDAGAEVVLVPANNYEDALRAAGDDIQVVRVETIDDALAFLETLEPAAAVAAPGAG